ncbi:MAG: hypothetical protein AAF378_19725 [Cyanobacteria bacterium P01_A01_bin.84]
MSEGWTIGRVWGTEGLWEIAAWRRQPDINKINVCIARKDEILWLHQVEEIIVMIEVIPTQTSLKINAANNIGNVVLKRLMNADQVIQHLAIARSKCYLQDIQSRDIQSIV